MNEVLTMKVEIWLDFTCPYSFIGKKRFDLALEQFEKKRTVELEFKSYELAPKAKKTSAIKNIEVLMENFNKSRGEALEMMEEINWLAAEIGLDMTFDNIVHTNTFHAHRLVKYASEHNKALPLIDLLFNSYFSRNENIGERHVLQRLAEQVGLLRGEVDTLLCLNNYAKTVKLDEQLAEEIGIPAAPFFIFNEEYALSGLQPIHIYTDILNELWLEEQRQDKKSKPPSERTYCTGENCGLEK